MGEGIRILPVADRGRSRSGAVRRDRSIGQAAKGRLKILFTQHRLPQASLERPVTLDAHVAEARVLVPPELPHRVVHQVGVEDPEADEALKVRRGQAGYLLEEPRL